MEKSIESTQIVENATESLKSKMRARVNELTSKLTALGINHTLFKMTFPGTIDDIASDAGLYVDVLSECGYTVNSHNANSTLLPDGNCFTTITLLVKKGSILPATKLIT